MKQGVIMSLKTNMDLWTSKGLDEKKNTTMDDVVLDILKKTELPYIGCL